MNAKPTAIKKTSLQVLLLVAGFSLLLHGNLHAQKAPDKILGADISFLPQLEARGIIFSDKGMQKDAIQILKDYGFNYIRLRIFVNPDADSGYSPKKGFCNL